MISGYIYAAVWFILAAYLFYLAVKESRFFFFVAPFFIFLGVWALVNELVETDLMGGVYAWIYRGVAVIMLLICGIKYYLSRKNGE